MSIPCFPMGGAGSAPAPAGRARGAVPPRRLARDAAERLLAPAAGRGARTAPARTRCTALAASPTSSAWRPCPLWRASAVAIGVYRRARARVRASRSRAVLARRAPGGVRTPAPGAGREPYMRARVGRFSYQLDLCRHRVVVAPTGHGELTYRHAEALAAGAVLVCQDLSHAETMFPFADRANVLYLPSRSLRSAGRWSPRLCGMMACVGGSERGAAGICAWAGAGASIWLAWRHQFAMR